MTRQQKIYFDAIKQYIQKNHCSPSYEEIGRMVGVRSQASVYKVVKRLVRAGDLVQQTGIARSLALVPNKLHGFNSCNRGHVPIWFSESEEVCPLCAERQKYAPPREVRISTD
jgi:SOS-response transcriptional repressor LexA